MGARLALDLHSGLADAAISWGERHILDTLRCLRLQDPDSKLFLAHPDFPEGKRPPAF